MTASNWTPKFKADLNNLSGRGFAQLIDDITLWRKTTPKTPLNLTTGWMTVTPEIAENMLLHNTKNRPVSFGQVRYYADMMQKGEWKKTGQPLIFDTEEVLVDAQHRLVAGYLSGTPFETFVIADVPADPTLFAYIDNNLPRDIAAQMQTAGFNGLAKRVKPVLQIAQRFDAGAYSMSGITAVPRLSPYQMLLYVQNHPELMNAAKLVRSEYEKASAIVGYFDVTVFVAFKILELHEDEDLLDGFLDELGSDDPTGPIATFHKKMADNNKCVKPMKKHVILACLIRTFNAWFHDENPKTIVPRVDAPFPTLAGPVEAADDDDDDDNGAEDADIARVEALAQSPAPGGITNSGAA